MTLDKSSWYYEEMLARLLLLMLKVGLLHRTLWWSIHLLESTCLQLKQISISPVQPSGLILPHLHMTWSLQIFPEEKL
jgi:hypothetical protein